MQEIADIVGPGPQHKGPFIDIAVQYGAYNFDNKV